MVYCLEEIVTDMTGEENYDRYLYFFSKLVLT
jgi:hypothetical protein